MVALHYIRSEKGGAGKKKKNIYGGKKKKNRDEDDFKQDSDEEEEADMLESKEVDYMSESSSGMPFYSELFT